MKKILWALQSYSAIMQPSIQFTPSHYSSQGSMPLIQFGGTIFPHSKLMKSTVEIACESQTPKEEAIATLSQDCIEKDKLVKISNHLYYLWRLELQSIVNQCKEESN